MYFDSFSKYKLIIIPEIKQNQNQSVCRCIAAT